MEYEQLHLDWWSLEPNARRTLRQEQMFNRWLQNNARGFILAVTGLIHL